MVGEPNKADEVEEGRALPVVTQPVNVRRVARDGTAIDRIDVLAEETPVALVYNGISHAVMMASPADLEDFALGFSVSEGIADGKEDVGAIEAVAVDAGIEVRIELSSRAFWRLKERRRTLAGRTGCGLCGVDSLEQTVHVMQPVTADLKVSLDSIHRALDNLPEAQSHNRATRSMHAAAFATPQGELRLVREDVGRHNALDKLIGHLLVQRQDLSRGFLVITSRASYEMVQKAASVGMSIVVAISAPTAYAIRLAEESGITLIGFARGDRQVIYSCPGRIVSHSRSSA